jgi:hypothetical protein
MSISWHATSAARFDVSGRITTKVSSSTIVMNLRDVGVNDVLVSKKIFCVIADVTTV